MNEFHGKGTLPTPLPPQRARAGARAMKRTIDLAVAVPATLIALPICLLLFIVIRLESRGNPLFIQWRVGRRQKPFRMLKLRTMRATAAHVPSHEVEPFQITRLGRFLRRLKLDELPQLWNVVTGRMSLVGPRPCLLSQRELIAAREELGLFDHPPGVTGPAQLQNIDMSEPKRLAQVEHAYFVRATPWTDLLIIIKTFSGRGAGDAAPDRARDCSERL